MLSIFNGIVLWLTKRIHANMFKYEKKDLESVVWHGTPHKIRLPDSSDSQTTVTPEVFCETH